MKVKPIDKKMLVHLMPNVLTKRNGQAIDPNECILITEIVQSYSTGILNDIDYSSKINKIRSLSGTKNYTKLKSSLPVYRIGYGPGKQINPLVPIDEEKGKCTVPEASVFLRAKSVGGKDSVVIVRIPDVKTRDEWKEKAKRIQELYGLPSNKGQINADRCRFISLDSEVKVNWNAVPLLDDTIKWDETDSNTLYIQARVERVPLNNSTALSVFAYLCGQKPEEEAIAEMETFSYEGSNSLATAKARNKAYKKWLNEYGKVWLENRLRHISRNHQDILYNEITCDLCYKTPKSDFALPISNKFLAELWAAQPKKGRLPTSVFHTVLLAKAKYYNPLKQLFSVKWTGIDQFEKLKKYIKVEHDTFFTDLKKHIIRGINMLLTDAGDPNRHINRFVFVLQSEETNIGKSVLLRKLTLDGIVPGYSSEFSFDDNGANTLMCTIPNLINEEVDSQTQNELKHLKSKISYSGGAIRLPYDRIATPMTRKATLWATVNPRAFLNAVNDRWIIHPIKSIDFGYTNKVDFMDMWRQCYAIWEKNPLAGELQQVEVKENSAKASDHLYFSQLETELDAMYEPNIPPNYDSKIKPLSIADVAKSLDDTSKYTDKELHQMSINIGRALIRLFPTAKYSKGSWDGIRGSFFCLKLRNLKS